MPYRVYAYKGKKGTRDKMKVTCSRKEDAIRNAVYLRSQGYKANWRRVKKWPPLV